MPDGEELDQFAEDFRQEVITEAEGSDESIFREEVFVQRFLDYIEEFGETADATVCHFQKRGMKVNGYSVGADEHAMDMFIGHCTWEVPPQTVHKRVLDQLLNRARNFVDAALEGLHKEIEPSTPAFDMALRIHELREGLDSIRVILITDGLVSHEPPAEDEVRGIPVQYHLWDLERLHRCLSSGTQREPVTVDFGKLGGPIPCTMAESSDGSYATYMGIIPGTVLASLYEVWGHRLLERNVRSFLQARGKVNQGIRDTILKEPHMFLTYNNGISITGDAARTVQNDTGSLALETISDFQIVNGGQTTASLYHALRKYKADLSQIQVPFKLTVIRDKGRVEETVALISKYANTQNRVSLADFASNDPFHRDIEELSRTIWAPDPTGGKNQTRWFYERARGQYNDEKNRAGTRARQKRFESLHPRRQKFTKTDLAKFENTWNQLPHLVSRGAQKNFGEFSYQLKKRNGFKPDPEYFESLIAKAIMFRRAEKIVSAQKFGGYRANIVTYTLAFISHLSAQRLDLKEIWNHQDMTPSLKAEVERLCHIVHHHITNPPGGQNITEWCKKEACWDSLLKADVSLSSELQAELLPLDRRGRSAAGVQGSDQEGDENILSVKKIPPAAWLELSHWARVTDNLESWQRGIVYSVGKRLERGMDPSWRQARHALKAYEEALRRGFSPGVSGK